MRSKTMQAFLLLLVALTLGCAPSKTAGIHKIAPFPGFEYTERSPSGVTLRSSGVVGRRDGFSFVLHHGLWRETEFLWIVKYRRREPKGLRKRTIMDVVDLSELGPGQEVAVNCVVAAGKPYRGKRRHDVIGIVRLKANTKTKFTTQAWPVHLLKAWSVDIPSGKFKKVNPNEFECENGYWGT